jgi:hypothetical protein
MAVQENFDIIGRMIRPNVLQAAFQPASQKIDDQRPFEVAIAVSPHNHNRRSHRPQLVKNRFCANITKMPDFIGIPSHFLYAVRQMVMRVSENKYAPRFSGFRTRTHLVLRANSQRNRHPLVTE